MAEAETGIAIMSDPAQQLLFNMRPGREIAAEKIDGLDDKYIDIFLQHPDRYSIDDPAWLLDNWPLWVAFYELSNQVIRILTARKRPLRWGSKAAVEILRFWSHAEDTSKDFKIKNDCTCLLGRLFNDVSGINFYTEKKRKVNHG